MHEIDFFSHLLKDCFDILQVVPAKSVPNKLMHFLSIFRKNRQDIFLLGTRDVCSVAATCVDDDVLDYFLATIAVSGQNRLWYNPKNKA